ncbi:magnesium transporter [Xylanibacillus composti]|uniref:Magnesium transporter MgtE n=1 Tax=Xylanibacillus composti TaxID=1572762 RepID=A0A8J4M316_9BACL|nr:magnesium transporter [Xylanibacillus composti]MDT9724703.1 magnesium transporter [Xylanibacillus composti]GIQ70309.1 magnesium transporter MgtE [Xylanibacillus composti]
METNVQSIIPLIADTIKSKDKTRLLEVLDELQPYDRAEIYRSLPGKFRLPFVLLLPLPDVAIIVQELEHAYQEEIISVLGLEKASRMMAYMENDDLADLLSGLSMDRTQGFLTSMNQSESESVQSLLQYEPDTAGGIMTNRFVWIKDHYDVREAVDKVKSFANYAENIYYLYVLDDDKHLVGVVSYRDLVLADERDKISDIMYRRVISVPVDMDQEEVARTMERYDFIALPVVDGDNRLAGIVTVDDILDVVMEEANEDIGKLSATGKGIDFQTSAVQASAKRLPWLVLLLFLGLLSGSIMAGFQHTLEQVVALTFFMPMIAGMTGNTGTQSLAIVVRGLVTNDIDRKTLLRLISREFAVGLIIGVVCGLAVAGISYLWQGSGYLGFVVGLSLFLTLLIGTMTGTLIPLMLHRFRIDPAVASGPLITTLNDLFSLSVYFGLATMFLSKLS